MWFIVFNAESQRREVRRDWKLSAPAGPSVRAAPQPQHGRPPTPAGKDAAWLCSCSRYEDFVSATKCRRNRRDRKYSLQYVTGISSGKVQENLNFNKQAFYRFGILSTV